MVRVDKKLPFVAFICLIYLVQNYVKIGTKEVFTNSSSSPALPSVPRAEYDSHSVRETKRKRNSTKTITPSTDISLQSWIDGDLSPWVKTGITKKMVDLAAQQGLRANRIQIIDGNLYALVSKSSRGPSRIWYWLWGLRELLDEFPQEIPNADFVLNTQDDPQVAILGKRPKNPLSAKKFRDYVPGREDSAPPPVFSAVKTTNNYDLLWPLWTIWGEDVEGASKKTGGFHDAPWKLLHPQLVRRAKENEWIDREGQKIFWRGSVKTNPLRRDLIRCSKKLVDAADVQHKLRRGKPIGALDRVKHKYLIYLDGKSFSSAVLPMLVSGSILLLPRNSPFQTLCQRAFRAKDFQIEFETSRVHGEFCRNISNIALDLQKNTDKTEKLAKESILWAEAHLSMDAFQQYMIAMLQRYSNLLKYTPSRTKYAQEVSWKLIKKNVKRRR